MSCDLDYDNGPEPDDVVLHELTPEEEDLGRFLRSKANEKTAEEQMIDDKFPIIKSLRSTKRRTKASKRLYELRLLEKLPHLLEQGKDADERQLAKAKKAFYAVYGKELKREKRQQDAMTKGGAPYKLTGEKPSKKNRARVAGKVLDFGRLCECKEYLSCESCEDACEWYPDEKDDYYNDDLIPTWLDWDCGGCGDCY